MMNYHVLYDITVQELRAYQADVATVLRNGEIGSIVRPYQFNLMLA